MTYETCIKAIIAKKAKSSNEDWSIYAPDMAGKLDIFLLNNRITDEQYNELSAILVIEGQ